MESPLKCCGSRGSSRFSQAFSAMTAREKEVSRRTFPAKNGVKDAAREGKDTKTHRNVPDKNKASQSAPEVRHEQQAALGFQQAEEKAVAGVDGTDTGKYEVEPGANIEKTQQPQKKRRGRPLKTKVDNNTCGVSLPSEVQSVSASKEACPSSSQGAVAFSEGSLATPAPPPRLPASSSPLQQVSEFHGGGRASEDVSSGQTLASDSALAGDVSVRSGQSAETYDQGSPCATFASCSSLASSLPSVTSQPGSSSFTAASDNVLPREPRDRQQDPTDSPGMQLHPSPRSSDGTLPDSGHLVRLSSPMIDTFSSDSHAEHATTERTRDSRNMCAPPDLAAVLASAGDRAEESKKKQGPLAEQSEVAGRAREARKTRGGMAGEEGRAAPSKRQTDHPAQPEPPSADAGTPCQHAQELHVSSDGRTGEARKEGERDVSDGLGRCGGLGLSSPELRVATDRNSSADASASPPVEVHSNQTGEACLRPSVPSPGQTSPCSSPTTSSPSSTSAPPVFVAPDSSGRLPEVSSAVCPRSASPSSSSQSLAPGPAGRSRCRAAVLPPRASALSPPAASASSASHSLREEPSDACASPTASAPVTASRSSSQKFSCALSRPQATAPPQVVPNLSSDERGSCVTSVSSAPPWSPMSLPQSSSPPRGSSEALSPLSPPPDVILSPVSPLPFGLGDAAAELKPSARGGRAAEKGLRRVEQHPSSASNSQQQQQALFFPPPPSPFGGNGAVLRLGLWLAERPGLDDERFTSLFESFLLHFDFIHAATQSTSFLQHAQLRRDLLLSEEEEEMPFSGQKQDKRHPAQQSGPNGNAGQNHPQQRDQAEEFEGILLDILSLRGGRGVHTAVEALVTQLKEK